MTKEQQKLNRLTVLLCREIAKLQPGDNFDQLLMQLYALLEKADAVKINKTLTKDNMLRNVEAISYREGCKPDNPLLVFLSEPKNRYKYLTGAWMLKQVQHPRAGMF